MVKPKALQMWSISLSSLFGKSPKVEYLCGNCGGHNSTRIPMEAIKRKKSYVICQYCGEINDTGIRFN